jgi:protein gp37
MNDISKTIGWATRSLNPVVGCTFGCPYCYARRLNDRFHFVKDFSCPVFFPERLKQLSEKKPQVIFMDSMSDIADWKPEWLEAVYKAMVENPQHKYLFLTKRIEQYAKTDYFLWNARRIPKGLDDDNVFFYVGNTVARQDMVPKGTMQSGDFWSIEPILEPIACNFREDTKPKWVIMGSETGNRKGKVIPQREWIESIVKECRAANIPVFMKGSLAKVWGAPLIQEFPW